MKIGWIVAGLLAVKAFMKPPPPQLSPREMMEQLKKKFPDARIEDVPASNLEVPYFQLQGNGSNGDVFMPLSPFLEEGIRIRKERIAYLSR